METAETEKIGPWKALYTRLEKRNTIQASAERPFSHKDASRTLKLGANYKWAVGFYDMRSVGAFSRDMDLVLENTSVVEPVIRVKPRPNLPINKPGRPTPGIKNKKQQIIKKKDLCNHKSMVRGSKIQVRGVYAATYNFVAVRLNGWTIDGTYTVFTSQRGGSNNI